MIDERMIQFYETVINYKTSNSMHGGCEYTLIIAFVSLYFTTSSSARGLTKKILEQEKHLTNLEMKVTGIELTIDFLKITDWQIPDS